MTRIICTIGPSSETIETLRSMAENGMAVARLNFSHGTHEQHARRIENIRTVNEKYGHDVKILQDLEGYRIRVGKLPKDRPVPLEKDDEAVLVPAVSETSKSGEHGPAGDKRTGSANVDSADGNGSDAGQHKRWIIPFDYEGDLTKFNPGYEIFIDDGNILLCVLSSSRKRVSARVVLPGLVRNYKGINIPQMKFIGESLSTKDRRDILFGIDQRVDLIAQSFVRDRDDMIRLKKFIREQNYDCPLIAKIENREGIDNLEDILAQADGVMVARGDLGVSLPIYQVPVMQKRIIRLCSRHGKIDITATQMLESMTENLRPTRAEVSDVANAVLDGSDYVMLSAETAVGKHPVESVRMMRLVIEYTVGEMEGDFF